jgi:hypothetical protein
MSEPVRDLSGHEIAVMTREFMNSDFFKHIFSKRLYDEMARALELADRQPELAHSWIKYRKAYEEIITVWLPDWESMDEEIDESQPS